MILKNHIATRFLTDEYMPAEIVQATFPDEVEKIWGTEDNVTPQKDLDYENEVNAKIGSLYQMVSPKDQTAFYITETVLGLLDMLKVEKKNIENDGGQYDWTVFKDLKNRKVTFIFPDNALLRFVIVDEMLHFMHVNFKFTGKSDNDGEMKWVMFYVDRNTGEQCDHFNHIDVKKIETFVYSLLCFFYLSENEEVIVEPGRKYGTKKSGKFINSFKDIPVTIVNSKWNITSIRTEEFGVRGHFRLQPYGTGMKKRKMIFIEPFKKNGYIRRAKKEEVLS